MSWKTIEEMFGPEAREKCPLPADFRMELDEAVTRLRQLSPEDRKAVATMARFMVSGPTDSLLHDEHFELDQVRYAQGRKRGIDDLTAELTESTLLSETRDWLRQNHETE